jgi:hypothetical protein
LPKFTENNVVTPKEHLDTIGVAMEDNNIEHEDVEMKLLVACLNEDVKKWFKGFADNRIKRSQIFFKRDGHRRKIMKCY